MTAFAPCLSGAIANQSFNFFSKTMSGEKEKPP
jgi:predicted metalloendopeptidase